MRLLGNGLQDFSEIKGGIDEGAEAVQGVELGDLLVTQFYLVFKVIGTVGMHHKTLHHQKPQQNGNNQQTSQMRHFPILPYQGQSLDG